MNPKKLASLRKQLEQALCNLGSTPKQVAQKLQKAKVKGYRRSPGRCPIAVYLQKKLKMAVRVNDGSVEIWKKGDIVCYLRFPDPVADFVRLFDSGQSFHELYL